MNKILFLGSNGFTGQHFKDYIKKSSLTKNFTFIGVDRGRHSKGDTISGLSLLELDISKYHVLENLLKEQKPDYIMNFIGIFGHDDFREMLQTNAEISRNIFEIIIKNKLSPKKILLVGSAAEYGETKNIPTEENEELNPTNNYGLSKIIQSAYANFYYRNYNLPIITARTFNILGEGISTALSVGAFIQKIEGARDGDSIQVKTLDPKRDFLDIEDVVDAYWKLLFSGKDGEVYNVCSGESHSIGEILNAMISASGKKLNVISEQSTVPHIGISNSLGNNHKLKETTGWKQKNNIFVSIKSLINT